jgi:hypothetical protein
LNERIPCSAMSYRTIHTVDELIDELGGTGKAAAHLGVTAGAVSHWRTRGRVPGSWHKLLRREFLDRHIIIDDSVFDDPWPTKVRPPRLGAA